MNKAAMDPEAIAEITLLKQRIRELEEAVVHRRDTEEALRESEGRYRPLSAKRIVEVFGLNDRMRGRFL